MNILYVTETTLPPINRANLRLYKFAKKATEKDHNAFFITPSKLPFKCENQVFEGIHVIQFPGFEKFLYSRLRIPVRTYHAIACIITIFIIGKRYKVDTIQAWNPLAGFAGMVGAKLLNKRFFLDLTDFYSCIGEQGDTGALVARVLRSIEKIITRYANKIFVVSDVMVRELAARGTSQAKIFIIEDGTDPGRFNPCVNGENIRKKHGISDHEVVILFHGDIKEQDGVDTLFKCFAKLSQRYDKIRMMIVGGGGEYFESDIKRLGNALEIDERIIYTGWIDHSLMPEYIAACDIGAMTMAKTLNHDCYISFKLFEYWGCAKPVVCTRLEAISKHMRHKVSGMVVEDGDIDGYVEAFSYLIENQEERKSIGKAGRALVEDYFNWDSISEKILAHYKP